MEVPLSLGHELLDEAVDEIDEPAEQKNRSEDDETAADQHVYKSDENDTEREEDYSDDEDDYAWKQRTRLLLSVHRRRAVRCNRGSCVSA